jgi:hypothetical protein
MPSRLKLITVMALFALPVLAALALHALGWRPAGSRAHGEVLSPARPLAPAVLTDREGRALPWRDTESSWHLLVLAPPRCDARCAESLALLERVWLALHRDARRLKVHWLGELDPALRPALAAFPAFSEARLTPAEALAELDLSPRGEPAPGTALPLLLVDPDGHLAVIYRPGFDPTGLRRDLARIIR